MSEFNGLTGAEARTLIIKALTKALEADTNFGLNVTYPRLKFEIVVKLETYPQGKFEAQAAGGYQAPGYEPAAGEKPAVEKLTVDGPDVGGMEPIEAGERPKHLVGHLAPSGPAPDEVRMLEGLPVPTKTRVPGVGTVDSGPTTT